MSGPGAYLRYHPVWSTETTRFLSFQAGSTDISSKAAHLYVNIEGPSILTASTQTLLLYAISLAHLATQ